MITLNAAASLYKFYNKWDESDDLKSQLYMYRTLDIICSIERLCYKIGKATLKNPHQKCAVITLKCKQEDWLKDPRVFNTAIKIIKLKYGNVTLSATLLNLTIHWGSSKTPVLNEKDHLNSKLFQAVLSNRFEEVSKLIKRDANVNASGPFGKRPLHFVNDNPSLFRFLENRGADSHATDDMGRKPYLLTWKEFDLEED